MAITAAQYKQLVINELDIDRAEYPDVLQATNMYWEMSGSTTDRETFLKTKIALSNWLLGKLRRKRDVTIGGKDSAKASQEFKNVQAILAEAKEALKEEFPASNIPTLQTVTLESTLPSAGEDFLEAVNERYYDTVL